MRQKDKLEMVNDTVELPSIPYGKETLTRMIRFEPRIGAKHSILTSKSKYNAHEGEESFNNQKPFEFCLYSSLTEAPPRAVRT